MKKDDSVEVNNLFEMKDDKNLSKDDEATTEHLEKMNKDYFVEAKNLFTQWKTW